MSKQVINVAFVGGGKGCYDILHQLKFYPPVHFKPQIIGVADRNKNAMAETMLNVLAYRLHQITNPFCKTKTSI
jgi:hypothetical protein